MIFVTSSLLNPTVCKCPCINFGRSTVISLPLSRKFFLDEMYILLQKPVLTVCIAHNQQAKIFKAHLAMYLIYLTRIWKVVRDYTPRLSNNECLGT